VKTLLKLSIVVALIFTTGGSARAHHLSGVIDSNGREIIPCKFGQIKYLGQGLFFAEEANDEQPAERSYVGRVFNNAGKALTIKIPKDFTLSNVTLPATKSDTAGSSPLVTHCPDGTVLEIHGKDGFGLCDLDGKILLEPKFGAIGDLRDGYVSAFSPPHMYQFTLNLKTGERKSGPREAHVMGFGPDYDIRPFSISGGDGYIWGYMNKAGDIVIQPKFRHAQYFTKEGFAVVEVGEKPSKSKRAFIDRTGKIVSPEYHSAHSFEDGIASVTDESEDGSISKRMLIDTTFKPVLSGNFRGAKKLFDNIFAVYENATGLNYLSFKAVNSKGEFLFNFPGTLVTSPHVQGNEIVCATREGGKVGDEEVRKIVHLDNQGKVLKTVSGTFPMEEYGISVLSEKVPPHDTRYSLLGKNGKVISQVKNGYLRPVAPDRIVKTMQVQQFHPNEWMHHRSEGFSREGSFHNFLRNYDLIGMSKTQVESLLGKPAKPTNRYYLLTGNCNHSWTAIELEYVDDKVTRWKEVRAQDPQGQQPYWITTNVVSGRPANGANSNMNAPANHFRTKTSEDRVKPRFQSYFPVAQSASETK